MESPEEYGKSKESLESTIKFTIQLIRMRTRCVPFLIALSLSLGTVLSALSLSWAIVLPRMLFSRRKRTRTSINGKVSLRSVLALDGALALKPLNVRIWTVGSERYARRLEYIRPEHSTWTLDLNVRPECWILALDLKVRPGFWRCMPPPWPLSVQNLSLSLCPSTRQPNKEFEEVRIWTRSSFQLLDHKNLY